MQQTTQTFNRLPSAFCGSVENASTAWLPGPASPLLPDDEVHVWRASLDEVAPIQLDRALSQEDRIQGMRFRFDVDRERFLVARASLRLILGRYLRLAPDKLRFAAGEHGKPYLSETKNRLGLRFNLSHSRDLALIAIARKREIGVDIEHMRGDFAGDEIAERFFSQSEISQLKSLAPDVRAEAFFKCWTRKEAYIKGRGEGLSFPLDQFDVSLEPNSDAALLANHLDPTETARWTLRALSPALDYAAAIAVEHGFSRLRLWSFDTEVNTE